MPGKQQSSVSLVQLDGSINLTDLSRQKPLNISSIKNQFNKMSIQQSGSQEKKGSASKIKSNDHGVQASIQSNESQKNETIMSEEMKLSPYYLDQ